MLSRRAMRPGCRARATYQRRQPEQTVLYRTIAAHLPTFLARTTGKDGTRGLPAFVRRDHVLPHVPIRQWVFTVPVPVRYQLAFDAALTRAVLRVVLRTVFGWLRQRAARRGISGGRGGAVTAIQRFGSALNTNIHLHSLVLAGVYTRPTPTARPVFHRLPPPTDADLVALLTRLHRRVRRLLARRGRLPEPGDGGGALHSATLQPLWGRATGVTAGAGARSRQVLWTAYVRTAYIPA